MLPRPSSKALDGDSQDTAGELRGCVLRFERIDPQNSLFLTLAHGD